jgi:riboflavin biosynthesis pyrimidine reductase
MAAALATDGRAGDENHEASGDEDADHVAERLRAVSDAVPDVETQVDADNPDEDRQDEVDVAACERSAL